MNTLKELLEKVEELKEKHFAIKEANPECNGTDWVVENVSISLIKEAEKSFGTGFYYCTVSKKVQLQWTHNYGSGFSLFIKSPKCEPKRLILPEDQFELISNE